MHVTLKDIEKAVCSVFQVSGWDLHAATEKRGAQIRPVAIGRQVVFYLARDLTGLSLNQIGAQFGRDHTTVLHGQRSIDRKIAGSHPVCTAIDQVRHLLERNQEGWDISTWFPLAAPAGALAAEVFTQYRSPECKCGRGPKMPGQNYCMPCQQDRYKARVAERNAEKSARRRQLIAFAQAHASSRVAS